MVMAEPTATPAAMVMAEPTPTAMVMAEHTPTPEAMVKAEHTPTPEAMVKAEHTPTPEAMVMAEHTPTPEVAGTTTPTPEVMRTPTPTPGAMTDTSTFQEVALIEDLSVGSTRSTPFFPDRIVVLKDIPVKLYLTRTHREHVNEFSIEPFYYSEDVLLPGELGILEFMPDQIGEFKVRNVGHNWEMTLVVVATAEEAKKIMVENGVQEFALIHSLDDFQIFPDSIVVQKDVTVKLYNISLNADHEVSVVPFYPPPEDYNVRPRKTSTIEFIPDATGQFTISHEIHGFTGALVVEEN